MHESRWWWVLNLQGTFRAGVPMLLFWMACQTPLKESAGDSQESAPVVVVDSATTQPAPPSLWFVSPLDQAQVTSGASTLFLRVEGTDPQDVVFEIRCNDNGVEAFPMNRASEGDFEEDVKLTVGTHLLECSATSVSNGSLGEASITVTAVAVDADGDGVDSTTDCNDNDARVHPGATEACDHQDEDCDGIADNGANGFAYQDLDEDGYGDPATYDVFCLGQEKTSPIDGDCDDQDAAKHPGIIEKCDGTDNNCNGLVDEDPASDAPTWYNDQDGDGFGDRATAINTCSAPSGTVSDGTDCDDQRSLTFPGQDEHCDGVDEDCDGTTDEEAVDFETWYLDQDGDGYGDDAAWIDACSAPSGYLADNTDCDDQDPSVSPAATESCNQVDDDCDGITDENDAIDARTWYADQDGDGYGDVTQSAIACDQPSGYTVDSSDCDDTDISVEDLGHSGTWSYLDSDGDGYGDPTNALRQCPSDPLQAGYVALGSDCNDGDKNICPGTAEVCDNVDQDCDGIVDDNATNTTAFYVDADGDGYGSTATKQLCFLTVGYSTVSTDCNDKDKTTYPGALEICDSADNDCDGLTDEGALITWYQDSDKDGFGSKKITKIQCSTPVGYVQDGTDCDDAKAAINPSVAETCDKVDNNCDGVTDENTATDAKTWYVDADGDSYGDGTTASQKNCNQPSGYVSNATDCNDADKTLNPTTIWYKDSDKDTYGGSTTTLTQCSQPSADYYQTFTDCDDSDPTINPKGKEICNKKDDDCDGYTDDQDSGITGQSTWYLDADGDNYGTSTTKVSCYQPTGYGANANDCDDTVKTVNPGATESCDAYDNDCDGSVNEDWADTDLHALGKISTASGWVQVGTTFTYTLTLYLSEGGVSDTITWENQRDVTTKGVTVDISGLNASGSYSADLWDDSHTVNAATKHNQAVSSLQLTGGSSFTTKELLWRATIQADNNSSVICGSNLVTVKLTVIQ